MHWFWRAAIAMVIPFIASPFVSYLLYKMFFKPTLPRSFSQFAADYLNPRSLAINLIGYSILFGMAVGLYAFLTRKFAPHPYDPETRCRKCGYILRGITEPRCSECGEKI